MRGIVAVAAAAAAAAAVLPMAGAAAGEDPAAVVHGRPLPRRDVHEALARRFLRGPGGEKVLRQFVQETVARREQEERGITVGEEEIDAAVDEARRRTAEQMARYGQKVTDEDALGQFLKSAGYSLEEFRAHTRQYLALQRMARADLGSPGEVPNAQIEVWLRHLQDRWKATTDPASLPPGAVAALGDEPLTWEAAGRWIAGTVRRHEILGAVYDLAFGLAVEARAEEEGIALETEDVAAAVERLRGEFLRQPAVEGSGVSFETWLRERRGLTVAELGRDPAFRANLLARKVLAPAVSEEDVRAEFEGERERYGERARIRRILVRGDDRPGVFGAAARPMTEARSMAEQAMAELRTGKPFEVVARKWSEDVAPDGPRGQPLEVVPAPTAALLPSSVLAEIFAAQEGELLGPLPAVDGMHIVLVERRIPAPSFEEARERVRGDIVTDRVREWRIAIRSDPEVVVAEDL